MARLDRRVRVLGAALRRMASITTMTPADIARAQEPREQPAALARIFGRPAPGVDITTEQARIPGPDARTLGLRIYRPRGVAARPRPLVVAYHGGGWTLGSVQGTDWLCSSLSAQADAVVVSVDYRLAPNHPFPAATEDAWAGLTWAVERAGDLGADPARVAVLGDSAGGNLAAVVALRARDEGGPRLALQVLLYPATDLTLAPTGSMSANADAPVLSDAEMRAFRRHYLAGTEDVPAEVVERTARDPRASPLLAADHAGVAPTLIQVADHDPLRDDGVRYAAALRDAGVPVRFTEYLATPHGYASLPGLCRAAPQALHEIVVEVRELLAEPPVPSTTPPATVEETP